MIEIYNTVLIIMYALAAIVFVILLKIPAPYGRHTRKGWGPGIPTRIAWLVMEIIPVIAFTTFFYLPGHQHGWVNYVFFGLFLYHYGYRGLIYPFRLRVSGKTTPLSIMLFGMIFNVVNGYLNGTYLGGIQPVYPETWIYDPRFIAGIILFFTGWFINFQSDNILINLRKPGETGYKIPAGGMFRYVSCPNYFGEILEWTGWALATWSSAGLCFAIWTAANLIPRAIANHRWYRQHFEDYPRERKAVIPFLL